MSLIDTTFGPLGSPLIKKWGTPVTFIRKGSETYNATTGVITEAETRIATFAIITKVSPQEYEGLYQDTDHKIIADPADIGAAGITTSDSFEYTRNNVITRGKVVGVAEYRGDAPVLTIAIVRPQ
jgi:hypothetical protein